MIDVSCIYIILHEKLLHDCVCMCVCVYIYIPRCHDNEDEESSFANGESFDLLLRHEAYEQIQLLDVLSVDFAQSLERFLVVRQVLPFGNRDHQQAPSELVVPRDAPFAIAIDYAYSFIDRRINIYHTKEDPRKKRGLRSIYGTGQQLAFRRTLERRHVDVIRPLCSVDVLGDEISQEQRVVPQLEGPTSLVSHGHQLPLEPNLAQFGLASDPD